MAGLAARPMLVRRTGSKVTQGSSGCAPSHTATYLTTPGGSDILGRNHQENMIFEEIIRLSFLVSTALPLSPITRS